MHLCTQSNSLSVKTVVYVYSVLIFEAEVKRSTSKKPWLPLHSAKVRVVGCSLNWISLHIIPLVKITNVYKYLLKQVL